MLDAELEGAGAIGLRASLHVEAGECLALTGPSGAGKTTALRALAGLERPAAGSTACAGERWFDAATRVWLAPEHRRVGMVFQHYALFEHLSAWRNVAYPMAGRPRGDRRSAACALLERLGLGHRADARPPELSGGERQRVALARALAREPALLLLDEPLSALDAATTAGAVATLGSVLRDAAIPAVLVTHDFAQAAQLADRIAVLSEGRVIQEGTASELASTPASAFVADLTGAVVLRGTATGDRVRLDGGGELQTITRAAGAVAVSLHPWDISLEGADATAGGSARNRLRARVLSVTAVGGRVRVGLQAGQPLSAEVTEEAVAELGLTPGDEVAAVFKASALRVVAR